MDLEAQYKEFNAIIQEYNLQEKADELADYVVHPHNNSVVEFAAEFKLPVEKAKIIISFIEQTLKLKESINE